MRLVLSLFLCLAMAFQGIAFAHGIERPCSMAQEMVDGVMDHSGSADGCCNDADTASKTGKSCKTGQVCSPSGAFVVAASEALAFGPPAFFPTRKPALSWPSLERSSIWRPPTRS